MKHIAMYSLIIGTLINTSVVFAGSAGSVTNGNNDGPGSLRAALQSGASTLRIQRSVKAIIITETLQYNGSRSLRLIGGGQIIDGSQLDQNTDIFAVTSGADVSISNLSFIGSADGVNPDPLSPNSGKGVFVNVPVTREGTVRVSLNNVSVSRVVNHGIHVSDCTLGDDCGSGAGGGGEGSSASIFVEANQVIINNVGFGKADADGIRVDERGDGDIHFVARNAIFINVGADGVELDEGNNGDVITDIRGSLFDNNGEYCNLIPANVVAGSPCDDDGDPDVDDGLDIDEAGRGSLFASIRNTDVSNNFDEGLDFDEEGDGGIEVELSNIYAQGNADEGIKLSEEDAGGITAALRAVTTIANNDDGEGIEIEEADNGNVEVVVRRSTLIGGEDEALKVEQNNEGIGTLRVRRSNIGTLDLDNVDEI